MSALSTEPFWSDDTTAGHAVKPTFLTEVTNRMLYGLRKVHYYALRRDGVMLCVGCGKLIIDTPYGEQARLLGEPLAWDEKACGGVERGQANAISSNGW